MKCEVLLIPDGEEKVLIYAKEHNQTVEDIRRFVCDLDRELLGYRDKEIVKLNPLDLAYITVIGGKVVGVRGSEHYLIKERLYTLAEKLPDCFVKINQSCLANLRQIERFDTSLAGTLKIRFQNGDTDYVSRRQLKAVKEKVGM